VFPRQAKFNASYVFDEVHASALMPPTFGFIRVPVPRNRPKQAIGGLGRQHGISVTGSQRLVQSVLTHVAEGGQDTVGRLALHGEILLFHNRSASDWAAPRHSRDYPA
jgi:hypothetical protein